MSDRIIGINKSNSNHHNSRLFFGGGTTAKIALLAAFFATFATVSANAGLFGSNKNSKNNNNNSNQDRGIVQIQLNDFQQRNINGTNLDASKPLRTIKSQAGTNMPCH